MIQARLTCLNLKCTLGNKNNQLEHGLRYNVIIQLPPNLQGTNRWLFFDNFFTGLPLLHSLLDSGLYACGTVHINQQGFSTALKKLQDVRQRGGMKIMQLGVSNITAVCEETKNLCIICHH